MAPPTTMAPPLNLSDGATTAPVRSPDDYRFVVSYPEGCSRADCNVFIGIDTNAGDNGFLDIYMEGTAEGWVAVGFSETPNMVSKEETDVNPLHFITTGVRSRVVLYRQYKMSQHNCFLIVYMHMTFAVLSRCGGLQQSG